MEKRRNKKKKKRQWQKREDKRVRKIEREFKGRCK